MAHWTAGDSVEVRALFSDSTETPVDPDAVDFTFVTPAGAETTLAHPASPLIIRQAIGDYVTLVRLDEVGIYRVRWRGTGVLQTAEETTIRVYPSVI